jgi:nucleotide-binding universal stress UspA family protein
MKILIAYDGSNCAESALDDLVHAGLPDTGEFLVLSVAEVWLAPDELRKEWEGDNPNPYLRAITQKQDEKNKRGVAEAETLAHHAAWRLQQMFPHWTASAEGTYGSPAWEILNRAAEWKPDLIVAGSHGRNAVGRLVFGSVSQKILTEAKCSVRIARGKVEVDPFPVRVIIGFDGSEGAKSAVKAVLGRNWREKSEFLLVTIIDQVASTALERFVSPIANWVEEEVKIERSWAGKLAQTSLEEIRAAGFSADLCVHPGNPKIVLIEEAEKWRADAIFVGARSSVNLLERYLIGNVSSAIAARAHCSVEIVRDQIAAELNKQNPN